MSKVNIFINFIKFLTNLNNTKVGLTLSTLLVPVMTLEKISI